MKPKISRIIASDFLCQLSLAFPIISWGMTLIAQVDPSLLSSFDRWGREMPEDASPGGFLIWLSVCVTLLFAPILILRIRTIQARFSQGKIVNGTITYIYFDRGRGRVEYDYEFEGEEYHSGNSIIKNKRTKEFNEGQNIDLVVTRNSPQHAYVKSVYLD